jgi:hypothetical protein
VTDDIIHYEARTMEDGDGKAVEKMLADKAFLSDDEDNRDNEQPS